MVQQISVFLENRAGQLAEITGLLAKNNVDLRAISIAETSDYGIVRMITDNVDSATAILKNTGYILTITPVQVVCVPNQPGGLASILALLAEDGIAVEYMYSFFTHQDDKAYMVFRVSNEEKFAALMTCHGINIVTAEALNIR